MTTLCTRCGEPVLVAQNGRVLTTKPTRLGLYDPQDGEILTQRDIATRIRDTTLAGHNQHHCVDGQGALFDTQETPV